MLAELGKTAKALSVAFVTCSVVVPTVVAPPGAANRAVIVELPGATPVASPFVPPALLTVATEAAEDVQLTAEVRSWVLLGSPPNIPIADKLVDIDSGTVGFDGSTDIEVKAADSTTMLAVPLIP